VDIASVFGIALALLGIIGGMMMEGGSIGQITQPTAAVIVLCGTVGAVLLQFPMTIVLAAIKQVGKVFTVEASTAQVTLAQIVEFANKARRSGVVSLDEDLPRIAEPFMKQALMLAVDGIDPSAIRQIMLLELENGAEIEEKIASVFEAAGGYSPTVGILGAVLGLIQVMQHLENINEVGRGIAVAFVATIYGVGLANLVYLPIAGKLKIKHREEQVVKEMVLEGIVSILEGMNPRMLELKLNTYLLEARAEDKPKQDARPKESRTRRAGPAQLGKENL
jgi:chemotaxis protein MotA